MTAKKTGTAKPTGMLDRRRALKGVVATATAGSIGFDNLPAD